MQPNRSEEILANYLKWWDGHVRETGQMHDRFLGMRQTGLRQLADSLQQKVEASRTDNPGAKNVLLTLEDLKEFATGSVVKCLGPEYAVHAGRRSLRIPNGELLLMSRILSIRGRKNEFGGTSSIAAEYDVPADAWYLEGEPGGRLPTSICIEIALQPCGVLSAYLGTPLRNPEIDYSFRNLDGEATFNSLLDARGKTVRARAELLKTIFYGTTIIQHFSFELLCGGVVFFEGKSSFGYFSSEAMAAQTGLDGGKTVLPWLIQAGLEKQITPLQGTPLETGLPHGKLHLLDGAAIQNGGGNQQEGYIYANRQNNPTDWFYRCHFKEDPVMPGSLGIEAILQSMQIFAREQTKTPVYVDQVTGQKMNWSYRGQVLQHHRQMQVEVHFHKTEQRGTKKIFSGNASLWADDSRIYEVRNLALAFEEKQEPQ
jgi:3-hydroxymyristoyl/3-hydroxydecanoyl-(acyl carrier protein) dehydratase